MALPADTFSSYDAIGNREDLTDIIYNIDPTDTPFLSGIPGVDATATKHEWQTDALATASADNAVLEGDEATTDATIPTVRLDNVCQISDKVPRVTGTQEAVVKAGRGSELEYQIAKRAKELKRDMESSLLANKAKVAGNATTARVLAGYESWAATNISLGATGSAPSGDGSDTATPGTPRALTEDFLKDVLKSAFDNGGDPDCISFGAFNKQAASTFTGNATRYKGADDKTLVAAIDVYDSDFGELQIKPNRFQVQSSGLVYQSDMWATAYLRPFRLADLSKTGDSERKQLIVEYCLEARNEKASGIIHALTTA